MSDNTRHKTIVITVPYGVVVITASPQGIINVVSLPAATKQQSTPENTLLLTQIRQAFQFYFMQADTEFKLPIAATGTEFQQRVWSCLQTIPIGSTQTYGEVAAALNTSPRAVANACRRNPTPIMCRAIAW